MSTDKPGDEAWMLEHIARIARMESGLTNGQVAVAIREATAALRAELDAARVLLSDVLDGGHPADWPDVVKFFSDYPDTKESST